MGKIYLKNIMKKNKINLSDKRGNITHSLCLDRHISRIHFAIEGSLTGGKLTAIIIVCQVTSLGRLSSQTWMTSASLPALRFH